MFTLFKTALDQMLPGWLFVDWEDRVGNVTGIGKTLGQFRAPRPEDIDGWAQFSIPWQMRTVSELRAKAEELRRMATTARTADVQAALLALAERFEALAVRRLAEQGYVDQLADDRQPD